MRHKKWLGLGLALVIFSSVGLAGTREFRKGMFFLTPQVGVNEWTVPFGVNAEWAVTPNIGVGGTTMLWLFAKGGYDYSVMSLFGDVSYHFTKLDARNLDLYAGGGLGFHVVSSQKWKDFLGESSAAAPGLFLVPFAGARYYFSPKTAVSLRLYVDILGDWAGVGAVLGVTFRLK